jgi:hypothetical protein
MKKETFVGSSMYSWMWWGEQKSSFPFKSYRKVAEELLDLPSIR